MGRLFCRVLEPLILTKCSHSFSCIVIMTHQTFLRRYTPPAGEESAHEAKSLICGRTPKTTLLPALVTSCSATLVHCVCASQFCHFFDRNARCHFQLLIDSFTQIHVLYTIVARFFLHFQEISCLRHPSNATNAFDWPLQTAYLQASGNFISLQHEHFPCIILSRFSAFDISGGKRLTGLISSLQFILPIDHLVLPPIF